MPLPKEFADYTSQIFGEERWQRFLSAMNEPVPVSIRYNPFKNGAAEILSETLGAHTPVPWCRDAYWLEQRPLFTADPCLHAGRYYVQEAGSQFIEHILRSEGVESGKILDMCAAPGGKSTLYSTVVGNRGFVVANEYVRNRANILADNIRKWGLGNVVVTNNDPSHIAAFENWFDVVAVDAPCSGEGMFRKDHEARGEWSEQNVWNCARVQEEILQEIWPALRDGGTLIYSTCTFNTQEDEENVRWMMEELGAELLPIATDPAWGITPSFVADVPPDNNGTIIILR